MKIRFRKSLTSDDLDEHSVADYGKVILNSCDQVQMKLTHIEMNSACLITCSNSLGRYIRVPLLYLLEVTCFL